ncbi:HNH endonuclease [Streptomyces sp. NPDC005438]|uniref:HNH endonuclease n=1 Tax=Streptomyces sp. NPDC005438 TaxID=3156880 RepID=UPI0033A18150
MSHPAGFGSFFADPSPRAALQGAVLMGANSRTYKFALAHTLLTHGSREETVVPMGEFATTYAQVMVHRSRTAPQVSQAVELGDRDFLSVVEREAEETRRTGQPTEPLVEAAARSMRQMVMRKFHNLRGRSEIPHRLYEIGGRPGARTVHLTPQMVQVATSEHLPALWEELEARWSIVEASYTTGIGPSLLGSGVLLDPETMTVTDRRRRRDVARLRGTLSGFQHGRCFLCQEVLTPGDPTAVDHVFPFSLMHRYAAVTPWAGPDLDSLWNLVLTHAACNSAKSDRLPTPDELVRLVGRNEAITGSQQVLSNTLRITLRQAGFDPRAGWHGYVGEVWNLVA